MGSQTLLERRAKVRLLFVGKAAQAALHAQNRWFQTEEAAFS
jgi:hypothetical protein